MHSFFSSCRHSSSFTLMYNVYEIPQVTVFIIHFHASLSWCNPNDLNYIRRHRNYSNLNYWIQSVYFSKNLRISCQPFPSSSHVSTNFTLNFSALFLFSCPFSLRHKSIIRLISIPTASRVPSAAIPFLARGLRPFPPVLTWKSSKATLRFSVKCAAELGWSATMGQQILRKRWVRAINRRKKPYKGTPLPRDSVTPLNPPWVTNHPVACSRRILLLSQGMLKNRNIIPGDLKLIAVVTM